MLKIQNFNFIFLIFFAFFILVRFYRKRRNNVLYYPVAFLFNDKSNLLKLRIFLDFLIFLFFVLSIMNFQNLKRINFSYKKGIAIILTLDTSKSMSAIDFSYNGKVITRLSALKMVIKDFIDKRPNDKIGIVIFGKYAFTQCPLTIDHDLVKEYIKNLQVGIAGDSTSIGDGLLLSIKRLKNVKAKSKVIILVTDGRNNSGFIDPITSAIIAKNSNIKIYTIGIGTKGKPVPIYLDTPFGKRKVFINADLDDLTLKKIAKITGGKYFNAKNLNELKEIYNQIDKMEKTEFKANSYYEIEYLYPYFLIPALIFILVKILFIKPIWELIP